MLISVKLAKIVNYVLGWHPAGQIIRRVHCQPDTPLTPRQQKKMVFFWKKYYLGNLYLITFIKKLMLGRIFWGDLLRILCRAMYKITLQCIIRVWLIHTFGVVCFECVCGAGQHFHPCHPGEVVTVWRQTTVTWRGIDLNATERELRVLCL